MQIIHKLKIKFFMMQFGMYHIINIRKNYQLHKRLINYEILSNLWRHVRNVTKMKGQSINL